MANLTMRKAAKRRKFVPRLQDAVQSWRLYTQPMREARKKMLEHYANGWYSNAPRQFEQPINLIDRGVQIIGPYLVANDPKVHISTKRGLKSNRPFARTMELALEHLFQEMNLAIDTLRPVVINSLFAMGITKTGIMHSHEVEIFGHLHDLGQPYCDNVDFEDYIGDVMARNRQEQQIEGNYYRLPADYVRDSGLYKSHDSLKVDYEIRGAFDTDTRPQAISKKEVVQQRYDDLRPMVTLIDLWIPDENIVLTIPPESQGEKIMRTVDWDGPETGPYDTLAYKYFPESIMPIPPVWTWLDLNLTLNKMVSKMRRQAERQKNIVMYELGASEDMKNVTQTSDGETVGVRNVDAIKEIAMGGINEIAFPFIQYLENQYSITGGNLYTLGGRATQAETLGQEQMLQANASKHLEDMVEQHHAFTKSILKKLAWFLWSDPLIEIPVIKRRGALELEVVYSEETREGDWLDYGFDIEPYSMSKMNPEIRYQKLMQLISQVVLPTAQIAAQQGTILDAGELVKEAARYMDISDIDRWWKTGVETDAAMNPYQPLQGQSSGQSDGRFDKSKGQATAGNLNNMLQEQSRAGGMTSPNQGQTTGGAG